MPKITLTVGNVSTCYEGNVEEVKELYDWHNDKNGVEPEVEIKPKLTLEQKIFIKEQTKKLHNKLLK